MIERIYDESKDESEPCDASTPGCSIDHSREQRAGMPDLGCEGY